MPRKKNSTGSTPDLFDAGDPSSLRASQASVAIQGQPGESPRAGGARDDVKPVGLTFDGEQLTL